MIITKPITKLESELADRIFKLKGQLSKGHRVNVDQYMAAIKNPDTVVMGAWDGSILAGIGVLNIVQTLSSCVGDIDDVVVSKDYRGQGVGRTLMEAIISVAKDKGATRLRLTSAARRVEANGLYQSLGFKLRETNSYVFNIE
jgi:GNAT superfamily N-acetyltransferase